MYHSKKTDKTEIFKILKAQIDEALNELSDFNALFGENKIANRVQNESVCFADLRAGHNHHFLNRYVRDRVHDLPLIRGVVRFLLINFRSRLMAIPARLSPILSKKTDKAARP